MDKVPKRDLKKHWVFGFFLGFLNPKSKNKSIRFPKILPFDLYMVLYFFCNCIGFEHGVLPKK